MKHDDQKNNGSINIQYSFKLPPGEGPKIGRCVLMLLVFFLTNLAFFISVTVKFIRLEAYNAYNILFYILIFCLGILFTAAAIAFMYKYIIVAVIEAGYGKMTPFFRAVSALLGERYSNDQKFQEKINKALDFSEAFKQTYGVKTPWLIKKTVSFFLNKIPFMNFLRNLSPDINNRDIRAVSEAVYFQMDDYIVKKLFPNNSIKWIFFLFPANIIIQIVLLLLLK